MTKCPIIIKSSQTVHSVKLVEYLEWAISSDNEDHCPLALPPIQRGFVWKPKQIQDLWDSIMRGMPIGSLMIQSFKDGYAGSINDHEREQKDTNREGWYLLDGQQRTLSMLLGFPSEQKRKHKLWVDFGVKCADSNFFQFRVTTEHQPFGFQPNGRKLSLGDRHKARERWNEEDTTERTGEKNNEFFGVKPWKSDKAQDIYIFEVSELWKWMTDEKGNQAWEVKVIEEIGNPDIHKDIKTRITQFAKNLKLLQDQSLALIELKERNSNDKDFLTLLFERISSSGTRLSVDDLLFSMIKQEWPEAHNLVHDLQKDVGSMMSPTDFVMTAFRLSAVDDEKTGDFGQSPKPADFHKKLHCLLGSEETPGPLRIMVKDQKLKNAFEKLKGVLLYRGNEDIGLPNALLPYLDRILLQVLLYWIIGSSKPIQEKDRKKIVQFTLFWMVSKPQGGRSTTKIYRASVSCIQLLRSKKNEQGFPIAGLYQLLTEKKDNEELFTPLVDLSEKNFNAVSKFESSENRAKRCFGEGVERIYSQFVSRKHLLLWFQRKWVKGEYEHTDFVSGQDDDVVPYDFDHLVPQSNWSSMSTSGKGWNLSAETDLFKSSLWARRSLGNSIGNYRVMNASENRSRSDGWLFSDDDLGSQDNWDKYAFDPNDDQLAWWKTAAKKENINNWDGNRVFAFQAAVESRNVSLYVEFFKSLSCEEFTCIKPQLT